jgi:CHAT domain-containing protein/tetratricopeptide (TPR) repeat protein
MSARSRSRLGRRRWRVLLPLAALAWVPGSIAARPVSAEGWLATGERLRAAGRCPEALAVYRQALPAAGEGAEGAAVLHAMGRCYRELGRLGEAAAAFRQSAERSARSGDGRQHAATLDDLGELVMNEGEFQTALDLFAEARGEFRTLHDEAGEARVLCHLGEVHFTLGAWQETIDASRQALAIQRRVGDRRGRLAAMRNLGAAYLGLKQWALARGQFEDEIRRARAAGNRAFEMYAETGLSYVHLMAGEIGPAAEAANAALRLARALGNRSAEANALGNRGGAFQRAGRTEQALADFARARGLYRQCDEPGNEAFSLFGAAETLERAGRLDEARSTIGESLAIVERLREHAAGSDLRASFLAARQDAYELSIRVLMQLDRLRPGQGFDALAFQAGEAMHARTLLEGLAAARLDLAASTDPALTARRSAAEARLRAAQQERDRLAVAAAPGPSERLDELDAEIRGLSSELEQVRGEMRLRDPRYRSLQEARPLGLAEIQREVLDPGTLLLAFALGTRESWLWSVSSTALHSHRLPGRAEIEPVAVAAYRALAAGPGAAANAKAEHRLAELSALILAPAAGELAGKRLLIVPDGALHYIPFAALPEPGTAGDRKAGAPLLVDAHEVAMLPSASVAALVHRQAARRRSFPKELAVLADPVFRSDDPRVHRSAASPGARGPAGRAIEDAERSARDVGLDHLDRIPYTRREGEAISGLVPAGGALLATDFEASRELALSPLLAQYRRIHLATHAFLDAVHPELSGLALSMVDSQGWPREGFLRAYEIYALHLPAELVVLSACRTALGAEVRGEGLMGLTRGFLHAGTARVVVSLWNVNDHATSDQMAELYRLMLHEHLAPAAALRAAQLATRKRWPQPYHWAAFELHGDWR